MNKKEEFKELKGKSVEVDAEWLKKNDGELFQLVRESEDWGRGFDEKPSPEEMIVRVEFDEWGTRYYATFKSHPDGVEQSLNNQPAWWEDSWEVWPLEILEKYEELI